MSSIIEAFDSTMREAFAGMKLFVWALPICFAIATVKDFGYIPWVVIGFFLLGFITTLANNVIVKNPIIVPGINIFEIIINAILSLIALLPSAIIMGAICWGANMLQLPNEVWNDTLHIMIWLFALAFPLTALAIFIRRKNILEVFNLKKFSDGYGEVLLASSFFFVQATIVSLVIIGFLAYMFYLFIGFDNIFWTYLLSVVAMFFVLLGANIIAQISDEIYTFPEKEAAKKKEKEAMDALTKHAQE